MIARTKSYIFTEIFLAVFPLGSLFWPAWFMFCIRCFSEQKSSSSKRWFYWRILLGISPVKTTWKWRHLFVWILLHCDIFVIRYCLLTEDCRKTWNFKYQKLGLATGIQRLKTRTKTGTGVPLVVTYHPWFHNLSNIIRNSLFIYMLRNKLKKCLHQCHLYHSDQVIVWGVI